VIGNHKNKTLVLGLGNPVLTDDGIGCQVARALNKELKEPDIDVMEVNVAGLDFLELLADYDQAIIIDAIQTEEGIPGQIYRFEPDVFANTCQTSSPHNINFATAITLGKQLGLPLPQQIAIFAIEVKDAISFGERCTPDVEAAIPECIRQVIQEIKGSHNRAVQLSGIRGLRHGK